jgi:class 3 adenylate cyclase
MDQRTNRTFICSVLYTDIVGYSKTSVEEQISLKERFNTLLSEILKDIAVNDRIILDTGDGAAIGFLGDPEAALFVAMELRDSIEIEQVDPSLPLSVRMGINLGPVKLLTDINKQLNLIGDGINVAQRVMSFAEPGKLLVSRSYYEVISCLSQEYAKLFKYEGVHADKHVREHGIYAVGHYQSKQPSGPGALVRRRTVFGEKENAVTDHREPERNRSLDEQVPGQNGKTLLSSGIARLLLHKKWLYATIPLVAVIILFVVFLIWRGGKGPSEAQNSAVPVVTVPNPQTAVAPIGPSDKNKTKTTVSSTALPITSPISYRKAADIGFTLAAAERKDRAVTLKVKLKNNAPDGRSVALYDDSYSWKKSQLIDQSGQTYQVREVYFRKDGKRITMHDTGKTGIPIGGGATITVYMVFKQLSEDSRQVTLNLHPFIYHGGRWSEHDISFPDVALSGGKGPSEGQNSAVPVVTVPNPQTAVAPVVPSGKKKAETPLAPAALPVTSPNSYRKAADIGFTLSAAERKDRVVTLTVRLKNDAPDERSVALYDDSYSWTKSRLIDQNGQTYQVREVYFRKDEKRITMHDTGKTGIPIDGGATVTVYLVFKQIPDDSRRATLNLHPFIYYGWQWSEHGLNFPDIALK